MKSSASYLPVIALLMAVLSATHNVEAVQEGRQAVTIANYSFEKFDPGAAKELKLTGWKTRHEAAGFVAKTVPSKGLLGAKGERVLMLSNGVIQTSTSVKVKRGKKYTLRFSIARSEGKDLKANEDFKVNLMLGSKIPAAFMIEEQLPLITKGLSRYQLAFHAQYDSQDFEKPLGIRIAAIMGATVYIDEIELFVEKSPLVEK